MLTTLAARLRRRPRVVAVAVVVGALLAWEGWTRVAASAADDVFARWHLDCDESILGSARGDPAIRSRSGWRCDLVLRVTNQGSRTARITGVEAPLLGSGGGAEIRGISTADGELRDARGGETVDGVFEVDRILVGGTELTLVLGLGWRERGCNSAGTLTMYRFPTVVFEVLGRTHRYRPGQALVLRTFNDPHDRTC